jgi:hypothetical protein
MRCIEQKRTQAQIFTKRNGRNIGNIECMARMLIYIFCHPNRRSQLPNLLHSLKSTGNFCTFYTLDKLCIDPGPIKDINVFKTFGRVPKKINIPKKSSRTYAFQHETISGRYALVQTQTHLPLNGGDA